MAIKDSYKYNAYLDNFWLGLGPKSTVIYRISGNPFIASLHRLCGLLVHENIAELGVCPSSYLAFLSTFLLYRYIPYCLTGEYTI